MLSNNQRTPSLFGTTKLAVSGTVNVGLSILGSANTTVTVGGRILTNELLASEANNLLENVSEFSDTKRTQLRALFAELKLVTTALVEEPEDEMLTYEAEMLRADIDRMKTILL